MARPARARRRVRRGPRPEPPRLAPLGWERKGWFFPPDLVAGIAAMSKGFRSEGEFMRYLVRGEYRAWLEVRGRALEKKNTPQATS